MLFSWLFSRNKTSLPKNYRSLIDSEALKIVERLQKAGFETYLVGGCVRDILLGKKPKDFDISTNATPQKVKTLIPRAFIIGKRFRIVVAKRPQAPLGKTHASSLFPEMPMRRSEKEFQITTFRRDPVVVDGKLNENVFGTAAEDAARRDFTINALFLDPRSGKILDFLGGLEDLAKKRLRIIGEPNHRFKEDPIRILRAMRFVARAGLKFEKATEQALKHSMTHLAESKRERVREEILKVFREGASDVVWELIFSHHALNALGSGLKAHFSDSHRRQVFLDVCRAINKNPWPQTAQAPFFYLILHNFFETNHASRNTLETILEELKVFKTEREEMERIQHTLQRVKQDPTGENAARLLGRNFRHYPSAAQAFYVLKVLGEAGVGDYASLWKTWAPLWEEFVKKGQGGYDQHFRRPSERDGDREHRGDNRPEGRADGRSSSRGGRSRRGGRGRRSGSGRGTSATAATTATGARSSSATTAATTTTATAATTGGSSTD